MKALPSDPTPAGTAEPDTSPKQTLPELSEPKKRELKLCLDALLDSYRLTGGYIDQYASANEHTRRMAVSQGPTVQSRWSDQWYREHGRAKGETGITPSVEVAKGRFKLFAAAYWPFWESGSAGYETYVDLLNVLMQLVLAELADIWRRSEGASSWYETACRPAIRGALASSLEDWTRRARTAEMMKPKTLEHAAPVAVTDAVNGLQLETLPGQAALANDAADLKKARALTVAKLITELDQLRPQMIEDPEEYERLEKQHPQFLSFEVAKTRLDLKTKILSIRGSRRHIRLSQELAAAHHGRQLSTIQDDWKDYKPAEFKRHS